MSHLPKNIIDAVTESLDRQVEDEQAMTKTTAEVKCHQCGLNPDGSHSSWCLVGALQDANARIAQLEAALAAAAVKVPEQVVRSAEILRDWLLPYGHPEKGMVGINPIALQPEELTYKSRDVAAMELCNFIIQLAGKTPPTS